jgi:hypothetical protein
VLSWPTIIAMIAVIVTICALYRDDLTLHQTSGSDVLDQRGADGLKIAKVLAAASFDATQSYSGMPAG